MTAVIQPEILPNGERIRLIKSGDEQAIYKPVSTMAKELKVKPDKLRDWAKLLLYYSPDFHQHYKPRTAYNPYVQEWLKRIHDYDLSQPKSAPRPQIIEDYVKENASLFTFKIFREELIHESQTEAKIQVANSCSVA